VGIVILKKLLCGLLLITLFITFIALAYHEVFAVENLDRYWSVLTGDQQIPPVNTSAVGFIALKFTDDVTRLVYIVNAEHINNITGVYLYEGDHGQNRTVVLDLLNGTRELRKNVDQLLHINELGRTRGTISIGGVTKDDLQGILKGKSLSELYKMIVDGSVYVDINTKKYPDGEIQGDRFVAVDRVFPDFTDFNWR
jgi:hypothetical protein